MNAALKGTVFSYSMLSADDADVAQDAAKQIRQVLGRSIVEAGRILILAKARLPHGLFRSWAEQELDMTARTAERCMQTARFVEGKSDTVSHLPPTVLYMLASPKADADVVSEVVAASEAGMPLTIQQVKTRLFQAENEAKEVAFIMMRAPKLGLEKAKARRVSELAAHKKEWEERQAADKARVREMQPIVERIASKLADETDELIDLLAGYQSASTFCTLLRETLSTRRGRA